MPTPQWKYNWTLPQPVNKRISTKYNGKERKNGKEKQ
jgi:hypothetical protein